MKTCDAVPLKASFVWKPREDPRNREMDIIFAY
jgi:hypothetical protein